MTIICDRLLFFSNVCHAVYINKGASAGSVAVSIIEYNNNCYLINKTGYGKFVVTNSIPCLRVVLADGTISSAKVTSDGVVTLTAAAKGKLIIDGTLDIECNY